MFSFPGSITSALVVAPAVLIFMSWLTMSESNRNTV